MKKGPAGAAIALCAVVCVAVAAWIPRGGFAAPASAFAVRRDGPAVVYDGQIVTGSADALTAILDSSRTTPPTVLRVTSTGGDASEALRMARIIRARGLDVRVSGYCGSSCAQYLFVAGRNKFVDQGSLVMFHGSPTALEVELSNSPLATGAPLFHRQSKAERGFYKALRLSETLLKASVVTLDPVCVAIDPSKDEADVRRYGISLAFPGYVLGPDQLARFGVRNVHGYQPRSQAEVNQALAKLPFRSDFRVRYVSHIDESAANSPALGRPLPMCEASAVNLRPQRLRATRSMFQSVRENSSMFAEQNGPLGR
jgi:hypothetical protein